jgi:aminoglycoside phosphotransferase (APT) family kinase protein
VDGLPRDAALPTLADAFDRPRLAERFADVWRRAEGAPVFVDVRTRVDTRYTPGVGCVVTYELVTERPDREPTDAIGVVAIDGAGASHRRFQDDPSLPALATVAEGGAMVGRLSAAFGEDPRTVRCDVRPLRYKPGRSCALRYELNAPSGVRSLFAKLFAHGADRHAAVLATLHSAGTSSPPMPQVPEPIGFWPDLGLVVQPVIRGADLTTAGMARSATASTRARRMREAGRALAALHTSVDADGPAATWERDLEELASYRQLVSHLTPILASVFDSLLLRLYTEARGLPEAPRVASHGAFRTDQVIVEPGGGLVFVDLDGYCRANPARDLANVLAYLEWRAIRRPADEDLVATASRAVLAGYAALAPAPDERWMRLYRAATMLKIAGRRLRRLAVSEWGALPELMARTSAAVRPT